MGERCSCQRHCLRQRGRDINTLAFPLFSPSCSAFPLIEPNQKTAGMSVWKMQAIGVCEGQGMDQSKGKYSQACSEMGAIEQEHLGGQCSGPRGA